MPEEGGGTAKDESTSSAESYTNYSDAGDFSFASAFAWFLGNQEKAKDDVKEEPDINRRTVEEVEDRGGVELLIPHTRNAVDPPVDVVGGKNHVDMEMDVDHMDVYPKRRGRGRERTRSNRGRGQRERRETETSPRTANSQDGEMYRPNGGATSAERFLSQLHEVVSLTSSSSSDDRYRSDRYSGPSRKPKPLIPQQPSSSSPPTGQAGLSQSVQSAEKTMPPPRAQLVSQRLPRSTPEVSRLPPPQIPGTSLPATTPAPATPATTTTMPRPKLPIRDFSPVRDLGDVNDSWRRENYPVRDLSLPRSRSPGGALSPPPRARGGTIQDHMERVQQRVGNNNAESGNLFPWEYRAEQGSPVTTPVGADSGVWGESGQTPSASGQTPSSARSQSAPARSSGDNSARSSSAVPLATPSSSGAGDLYSAVATCVIPEPQIVDEVEEIVSSVLPTVDDLFPTSTNENMGGTVGGTFEEKVSSANAAEQATTPMFGTREDIAGSVEQYGAEDLADPYVTPSALSARSAVSSASSSVAVPLDLGSRVSLWDFDQPDVEFESIDYDHGEAAEGKVLGQVPSHSIHPASRPGSLHVSAGETTTGPSMDVGVQPLRREASLGSEMEEALAKEAEAKEAEGEVGDQAVSVINGDADASHRDADADGSTVTRTWMERQPIVIDESTPSAPSARSAASPRQSARSAASRSSAGGPPTESGWMSRQPIVIDESTPSARSAGSPRSRSSAGGPLPGPSPRPSGGWMARQPIVIDESTPSARSAASPRSRSSAGGPPTPLPMRGGPPWAPEPGRTPRTPPPEQRGMSEPPVGKGIMEKAAWLWNVRESRLRERIVGELPAGQLSFGVLQESGQDKVWGFAVFSQH